MAPFKSLTIFLSVVAAFALVSTISDTSTGERSWGVLKEGIAALSYVPGLPSIGISTNSMDDRLDSNNSTTTRLFTRGVTEMSRALKEAATDDTTATAPSAGGDEEEDATATEDDDVATTMITDMLSNATSIIPPEPAEQPRTWPATVLVIFLILAAVLLGLTAFRNCRKKSQYTDIPTTSLIV